MYIMSKILSMGASFKLLRYTNFPKCNIFPSENLSIYCILKCNSLDDNTYIYQIYYRFQGSYQKKIILGHLNIFY